MIKAAYIAAQGMMVQEKVTDTIANNIANASTPAFKNRIANSSDLSYQTERKAGSGMEDEGAFYPTGIQYGNGVSIANTAIDFSRGMPIGTEQTLDVRLEDSNKNPSFFIVNLPNGDQAYTRSGNFSLDRDGRIVTVDGFVIDPETTINGTNDTIKIDYQGNIQYKELGQDDDEALTTAGQFNIASFTNVGGLESIGHSLFKATYAVGDITTGNAGDDNFPGVKIIQRSLESSNTSTVKEMANLIKAQQTYTFNSKVLNASKQVTDDIIRIM